MYVHPVLCRDLILNCICGTNALGNELVSFLLLWVRYYTSKYIDTLKFSCIKASFKSKYSIMSQNCKCAFFDIWVFNHYSDFFFMTHLCNFTDVIFIASAFISNFSWILPAPGTWKNCFLNFRKDVDGFRFFIWKLKIYLNMSLST